ncbi:MAG TPA: FAD-binding oxidoreductase [Casimicrobiaceae bacterium]
MSDHEGKKARLLADLAAAPAGARPTVSKPTSNLFRDRARAAGRRVSLAHFDEVIDVDAKAGFVDAEGMITYEALADATLAHGAMPAVVPQLKSITLGGAVAGVGIEASSFRHGLVHDTVVELEILTGDGAIVTCTAENEHRDLFFGFPNSYGTLGYALRVRARTVPVRRFVAIEHSAHSDPAACFADVARRASTPDVDFIDGVVFARGEHYVTVGRFVDDAPSVSDYGFEHIYYRSIREKTRDWLSARDWLWRWDTDWFWCSKNVGAQLPLVRRLYGRRRLNSITYQKIMRWNSRWGLSRALNTLRGLSSESVIQDIDIPISRAPEFLAFLHDEVGILPIWICPIRAPDPARRATLYPLAGNELSINFGFWDAVTSRERLAPGHRNRRIEAMARELGGVKSLYSDSYFTEEEFWSIYDRDAWTALKRRYDPKGTLGDLYAKCVRRA